MTTTEEAIQLIVFLRDHRFIGKYCVIDDSEPPLDHEALDCPIEGLEYQA